MMTPEEFASRMLEASKINFEIPGLISCRRDVEESHIAMDDLMCEVLREAGYGVGIDIFVAAEKWYC